MRARARARRRSRSCGATLTRCGATLTHRHAAAVPVYPTLPPTHPSRALRASAVVYCVDNQKVPDFNSMYELYDPCTVMFFFRNKHIMVDLGTGNNNKINWALTDKQEFIDIVETVFKGARKGRGLVVSPKDYSTKLRY